LAARARGDLEKMREYFLLARQANGSMPQTNSDPGMLADLALIDAGLGNRQLAIEEGKKAVELRPISRDAVEGPEYVEKLARAYALLGERERALEQLSVIAKVPAGATCGDLKFDPVWDELRDDPRFAQIMEEAKKPIPLQ
jgi:tetratricopeptide (TPR) repeat protein